MRLSYGKLFITVIYIFCTVLDALLCCLKRATSCRKTRQAVQQGIFRSENSCVKNVNTARWREIENIGIIVTAQIRIAQNNHMGAKADLGYIRAEFFA